MPLDRPIVQDEEGQVRQLPLSSPLTVRPPNKDDHAVTLKYLEQLIKENQGNNNE
jgi:hypothetical protein